MEVGYRYQESFVKGSQSRFPLYYYKMCFFYELCR